MKGRDLIIVHPTCHNRPYIMPPGVHHAPVVLTTEFPPCEQFIHHGSILSATVAGTPLEDFARTVIAPLLKGKTQ